MNKKITRKDFIRKGASVLGVLALYSPVFSQNEKKNGLNLPKQKALVDFKSREGGQIRGSWIRKGKIQDGDVILSQNSKVCQIVVTPGENSAVQQAAQFLANDIEKISGSRPSIVRKSDGKYSAIHLVTYGKSTIPKEIGADKLKGQWESHRIVTSGNDVWLVGADFRGTAFAAYTLSERLGIDPLYIWTDYRPETFPTLVLQKTDYDAAPPAIKYRGLFHDDEDILPRPFDRNDHPIVIGDINIEWYKRYFETALRLRMNMVAPYTRAHRRYEVQKTASDWGLFYTSHHYDILLSNPFGLERFNLAEKRGIKPEWNWFKNKEGMLTYWKDGVLENGKLNCIWPVGLRGTSDRSYSFPKGMSVKQQDKIFNDVINLQVQTVKKNIPSDKVPIFHFTLYTEMLEKYQEHRNEFNLPEDVIIVWPDNNNGIMRALPKDTGKWKHGVYYHLSYLGNPAITKQITHVTSPRRIANQFRQIVASGATEFCLVNVSELRDFILGARMIARIGWEPGEMLGGSNPAERYLKWWTREYFGNKAASESKKVYDRYYQLISKPVMLWNGSDMVQSLLGKLIDKFNGKSVTPADANKIQELKKRDREYQETMDIAEKAKQKMNHQQQQYFFENALLGLLIDWRPTQAALKLNEALSEPDHQKAWALVEDARKPLEQLKLEISRAERPPFKKWYRETWIRQEFSPYNVHRPYEQVRAFLASGGTEIPKAPDFRHMHFDRNAFRRYRERSLEQDQIWARFLDNSDKLDEQLKIF